MKITLNNLKEIIAEVEESFVSNFITNVIMINSSDFIMTNSFNRENKLIISLNHATPFISLIEENHSLNTVINPLLETLRKEVKNAYVINISVLDDDRIVVFDLAKNNEFYEKIHFKMILELIPYRPNLLLIDESNKVTYAAHYSSLDSSRPIIKGLMYQAPEPLANSDNTPLDKDAYKAFVNDYFLSSIGKRKKEKNAKLLAVLKAKVKSLNNKIKKLNVEINSAENNKIYQEIGQTIYTLGRDIEQIREYLKTTPYELNEDISLAENAENCFKKYKKSKRAIEANNLEIKKAEEDIFALTNTINAFDYLDDSEIQELEERYLKVKHKNNKNIVAANMPSYITFNGVKIGFGKNSIQNEYLTFKLAKKEDVYLHFANRPANHVVIFSNNPSNDILQVAAELVCVLSGQSLGEIYYTTIKNVKKGDKGGLVNLLEHKSITIHKVSDKTKDLLIDIKRFSR